MKYIITALLLGSLCPLTLSAQETSQSMNSAFFSLENLENELDASGKPWLPFLQGENVLAGLYYLRSGTEDRQQPHDTDEIYYVLKGKSMFEVESESREVKTGDVIFVKAEVNHRFYDIKEDLKLLVFFDQ